MRAVQVRVRVAETRATLHCDCSRSDHIVHEDQLDAIVTTSIKLNPYVSKVLCGVSPKWLLVH